MYDQLYIYTYIYIINFFKLQEIEKVYVEHLVQQWILQVKMLLENPQKLQQTQQWQKQPSSHTLATWQQCQQARCHKGHPYQG